MSYQIRPPFCTNMLYQEGQLGVMRNTTWVPGVRGGRMWFLVIYRLPLSIFKLTAMTIKQHAYDAYPRNALTKLELNHRQERRRPAGKVILNMH